MPRVALPGWLRGRSAKAAAVLGVCAPQPLGIYYGWPSAVNGANGDVGAAADTLGQCAVVVLGDGLQAPQHPDHAATTTIVSRLRATGTTRVLGYVDLGVSTQNLAVPTILERGSAWQQLGAHGIFLDDAGADYGVEPSRRDAAIRGLRDLRVQIVLNANEPDDAFRGRVPLQPGDGYLLESFPFVDGRAKPAAVAFAVADRALAWVARTGADLYAVATGAVDDPELGTKAAYTAWVAALYGVRYLQYTPRDYGAHSARLPKHTLPSPEVGTSYRDAVVSHDWSAGIHRRATDRGTVTVQSGHDLAGKLVPHTR